LTFIAVDGEGQKVRRGIGEPIEIAPNDWDFSSFVNTHEYVLLTVGDEALHRNGRKLTHHDIFPFLYGHYQRHPKAAYIGYFLGYDFTMWLQSINPEAAHRLLTIEGQNKQKYTRSDGVHMTRWVTTDDCRWDLQAIWPKRIQIRPHTTCKKCKRSVNWWDQTPIETRTKEDTITVVRYPWMTVCDVGPFWGTSFLKAINPTDKNWPNDPPCTPAQYEVIARGKIGRGDTLIFNDEMMRYNAMENVVLQNLMERLQEGLRADGIYLDKTEWYGPGSAAHKWLAKNHSPTRQQWVESAPIWARRAARDSYYGGWFEIFYHGIVEGTSYQYDINSAYPEQIVKLPCLKHGRWTRGTGRLPKYHDLLLVHIEYEGDNPDCGPLPHRRADGAVLHPMCGRGWYWKDEVDAAIDAGLMDEYKVSEWVAFSSYCSEVGCDNPYPFAGIQDLYDKRIIEHKQSPKGKGRKLVINSVYGKLTQSVGGTPWSNVVYASRITSGCRKKILQAISTHPSGTRALLMIATDGIVFATEHPTLKRSASDDRPSPRNKLIKRREMLGEWDRAELKRLALFLPGVYWDESSRENMSHDDALREEYRGHLEDAALLFKGPNLHSRGVGANDLASYVPEIESQWCSGVKFPEVPVKMGFAFIGAKIASYRRDWASCGHVPDPESGDNDEKTMRADSNSSKRHLENHSAKLRGAWPSSAIYRRTTLDTYPYPRVFGDIELDMPIDPDPWESERLRLEDTE
jgi:hypothetical protein